MVALTSDQVSLSWPVCSRVVEGCTGIQIDPYARCLEHLSGQELNDVLSRLRPGARLDIRGTIVTPDILGRILGRLTPRDGLTLTGPEFGDALFESARFTGRSNFAGARFNGLVVFDQTWFEDDVSFDATRFGANVWFGSARFVGRASFTRAEFRGRVSFQGVGFSRACSFEEAYFWQSATFERAEFFQHSSFSGARFNELPSFEEKQFHRGVSFDSVQSMIEPLPTSTDQVRSEHALPAPSHPTDIQIFLSSDRPPDDQGDRAAGGFIAFVMQHQAALVVLLGFLIYFMVRAAHDAFYGRFGVTPEQTGLSYVLMVGRAALGLGAYLVVLAILLPAAALLASLVTAASRRFRRRRIAVRRVSASAALGAAAMAGVDLRQKLAELRRQLSEALGKPWAVVSLILLSTLPFLLFFYLPIWSDVPLGKLIGFVVIVAVLIALIVMPRFFNRIASNEARGIGLLVLLFAVLMAGALGLSRFWGENKAEQVKDGRPLLPGVLYRGLVGIRTQRVCLTWIAKNENDPRLRRPVMYLGAADGTTVVYDYTSNNARPGTLRMPSAKVVVYDAGSGNRPDACPPAAPTPTPTPTSTSTPFPGALHRWPLVRRY